LDKFALAKRCKNIVDVPKTQLFEDPAEFESWAYPLIIKPRVGSGSRGVRRIDAFSELVGIQPSRDLIVQEFLPGTEYSVDVLADANGTIRAVVPRERMLVDSGVAVVSRTVRDKGLMSAAAVVAMAVGITHIANVQLRRRPDGTPALLEVNPRTPGTMPLTVASGVNMPALALAATLGNPALYPMTPVRELAVVRYLEERFIHPSELQIPRVDSHLICRAKIAANG
jgi:carbamoyl-phosphate synthase large subunit